MSHATQVTHNVAFSSEEQSSITLLGSPASSEEVYKELQHPNAAYTVLLPPVATLGNLEAALSAQILSSKEVFDVLLRHVVPSRLMQADIEHLASRNGCALCFLVFIFFHGTTNLWRKLNTIPRPPTHLPSS